MCNKTTIIMVVIAVKLFDSEAVKSEKLCLRQIGLGQL